MKSRLLLVCFLAGAVAAVDTAAAQTSSDSLAVEAAVARHFKPWLAGKNGMLDSRFGLTQKDGERPPARIQAIAQILGVPVAHAERVIGCKADCMLTGAQVSVAVAISQMTITGDTAFVAVRTLGTRDGRTADTYGEQEIVTKTNGVWKVTRTLAKYVS